MKEFKVEARPRTPEEQAEQDKQAEERKKAYEDTIRDARLREEAQAPDTGAEGKSAEAANAAIARLQEIEENDPDGRLTSEQARVITESGSPEQQDALGRYLKRIFSDPSIASRELGREDK